MGPFRIRLPCRMIVHQGTPQAPRYLLLFPARLPRAARSAGVSVETPTCWETCSWEIFKFTEEISTNCWICRYFQGSVMVSTSKRTLQGVKNSIGKEGITSVHSWSLTDHDSEPKKFQVSCVSQNFHICFPWYKPLNMSATRTLRVLTLTLRRCNLKRVSPTTKLGFDTLWSSTWATLQVDNGGPQLWAQNLEEKLVSNNYPGKVIVLVSFDDGVQEVSNQSSD